jgi:hypothetical protein
MADLKISQLTGATTPLAGTEVLPIVQSSSTKKVAVSDLTAGRDIATKQITSTVSGVTTALDGWSLGNGTANAIFKLSGATYAYRGVGSNYVWIGGDGSPMYIGTSTAQPVRLGTNAFQNFTLETDNNMSVNNAGNGFKFNANTPAAGMTSQLLNWYEEGAWTPSVGGNATYYVQEGYYTRVGRLVYIRAKIVINVLGTGSTTAISGLPFTSAASTYALADTINVNYYNSLAVNALAISGLINSSSTQIFFNVSTAAGVTTTTAGAAVFGDAARLDFSGCYQAA